MDDFGQTDSRKMPAHLFWGALYFDHETAIRANPEKQNFTICPRFWYLDAAEGAGGAAAGDHRTVLEEVHEAGDHGAALGDQRGAGGRAAAGERAEPARVLAARGDGSLRGRDP